MEIYSCTLHKYTRKEIFDTDYKIRIDQTFYRHEKIRIKMSVFKIYVVQLQKYFLVGLNYYLYCTSFLARAR